MQLTWCRLKNVFLTNEVGRWGAFTKHLMPKLIEHLKCVCDIETIVHVIYGCWIFSSLFVSSTKTFDMSENGHTVYIFICVYSSFPALHAHSRPIQLNWQNNLIRNNLRASATKNQHHQIEKRKLEWRIDFFANITYFKCWLIRIVSANSQQCHYGWIEKKPKCMQCHRIVADNPKPKTIYVWNP